MRLNRTKDAFHVVFHFPAQYFQYFFDDNKHFISHPQIMATLDPIFSSLQRGRRQAARLHHDQPKQLIS